MKIESKHELVKQVYVDIIACLNGKFFDGNGFLDADFTLLLLDDPVMDPRAVDLIKATIDPIHLNDVLESFHEAMSSVEKYAFKGETTAFFIPLMVPEGGKWCLKGIILKPHLQLVFETNLETGETRNERFVYTNTEKIFKFFMNLLINMELVKQMDVFEKERIADELLKTLLDRNPSLKFKSRSIYQFIGGQ